MEPLPMPTPAELVIHRPGRALGLQPGLTTDIFELLKLSRKGLTSRDVLAKLRLPERRYGSVRTTLWNLLRAGYLEKDPMRGYRAART